LQIATILGLPIVWFLLYLLPALQCTAQCQIDTLSCLQVSSWLQ
jgi:hypothetical protein